MMGRRTCHIARAALLAAATFVVPAPVAAQDGPRQFTVPDGCTAFLTVQSRSCMVSHHWTCEGDPDGTHWRVSLDSDGPFYLSFTDAEFRWLQSWELRNDIVSTIVEPEDDPASMTEMLETGSDAMVFTILSEGPGGRLRRDYTGFDRLTGEVITVDGERLEVTEFAYQFDTSQGVRRTEGNQFVHRDWRLFFGGLETTTAANGDTFEGNYSPMQFAEPGERGFLTTQPSYDCGEMMSAAPSTPVWSARQ